MQIIFQINTLRNSSKLTNFLRYNELKAHFESHSDRLSRLSPPGLEEGLEEDDDIEVDVEECSDGETSRPCKNKSSRQSPVTSDCGSEPTENDRESPDVIQEKVVSKTKIRCNCEELLNVECHLETKELWDKFHDLGTEMIITKTGR